MPNFNRLAFGAATLSLMVLTLPALAQESCAELDTALTVVRAQEFAPLVAQAAEGTKPEQVEFMDFATSGDWSFVHAATPVADPGFFFFQKVGGKHQFKDVWGGIALASERPEVVSWADALGAPANLTACFADSAVGDEE